LDFNGAVGQIIAAVLLGIAQMEKENVNERIRAGLAARKAKGLPMGRRPGQCPKWSLSKRRVDPQLALSLHSQGVSVAALAQKFGCSRPTVYTVLREAQAAVDK